MYIHPTVVVRIIIKATLTILYVLPYASLKSMNAGALTLGLNYDCRFSDRKPKLIYRLVVENLLMRIVGNIDRTCSDRIDA